MNERRGISAERKPGWLKSRIPSGEAYFTLKRKLEDRNLPTICQSARCPNIDECWNHGHATFLAMGSICSRHCLFCSVKKGTPSPLDEDEPQKILDMARLMNLRYLVVTSVSRDDLQDNGSGHLSRIIRTLRLGMPGLRVELLIPDFAGEPYFLDKVIDAKPDVLSHNLETVRSIYPSINRPIENYSVSLRVIGHAKKRGMVTKSGVMVGLGESREDLHGLFHDLRAAGTDLLTIGQYLQPVSGCVPVVHFYRPEDFAELKEMASAHGFCGVEAGPFVRSSYRAERLYETVRHEIPAVQ